MSRWLVAAAAVAAAAATAAAQPETAYACSCAREPVATMVARADAAFVGTVQSRREVGSTGPISSSGDPAVVVFAVERVAKGELPRSVEVTTARDSASCGLEAEEGARLGLVVNREGREWSGNLCGQVGPEELIRASVPGAGLVDENGDDRRLVVALSVGSAAALAALALLAWRWRARRR